MLEMLTTRFPPNEIPPPQLTVERSASNVEVTTKATDPLPLIVHALAVEMLDSFSVRTPEDMVMFPLTFNSELSTQVSFLTTTSSFRMTVAFSHMHVIPQGR